VLSSHRGNHEIRGESHTRNAASCHSDDSDLIKSDNSKSLSWTGPRSRVVEEIIDRGTSGILTIDNSWIYK
jgi:hypothetical protein